MNMCLSNEIGWPYTPKSEEPRCLPHPGVPHPGHPDICTKNQLLLDTAGLTVMVAANPREAWKSPHCMTSVRAFLSLESSNG